jgi:diguanylate cyclase (GGDEF)-like protein
MTRRALEWSLAILIVVFCLAIAGLFWFRRALRPLRKLHEPLSRLAKGELDLKVPDGGHAELVAINDALATTISALHQRDRKLREAANFDPLTGLVSRAGLNEEVEIEIQRVRLNGTSSALLFVDLDQFKYVNDTVGHAAGDRLLVRVAGLFRSLVDGRDLVCRYGGDEFIILQRGAGRGEAEQLAMSIVESMREIQFVEEDRAFNVRCSIGVAMIDGSTVKAEELLAQADMACHEAKGQGRNRFQMFVCDRGEREQVAADMGWSERIREALHLDSFALRYQPIVDVWGGPPVLYEVLLRMRGQGRKVFHPGAFLPAADRFGLMGDLDYWVIRNAFAKLAEVRKERPEIVFALNLSGIAFSDSRLVQYVAEQLDQYELPGSSVVFEITEQVAIRHIQQATIIMQALIDMGCRFALDDFGAGFSSFNYLKQLPVSFIKIDGAFIENLASDPADRAIVTSIAQIAHTIGTQTIAEHVRNEETLAILREIGIDLAQGYFLGRPRIDLRSPELAAVPQAALR